MPSTLNGSGVGLGVVCSPPLSLDPLQLVTVTASTASTASIPIFLMLRPLVSPEK